MSRRHRSSRFTDSCSSSVSTVDAIYDVQDDLGCRLIDANIKRKDWPEYLARNKLSNVTTDENNSRGSRYDPGISYFTSVVTPITNLSTYYGIGGSVEFRMRRKNKTVTLQWEPFSGMISSNGVAYLTISQTISNTPPYPISFPLHISHKGVGKTTRIEIDPFTRTGNIKLYINTDGSSENISSGDNISVLGGSVSWIVD